MEFPFLTNQDLLQDPQELRKLLENGANPDEKDENGVIPLQAAIKGSFDVAAHLLLDVGVYVPERLQNGQSLLTLALENRMPIVAERLFIEGAALEPNTHFRGLRRPTMLHHAAGGGSVVLTRALLQAGVPANVRALTNVSDGLPDKTPLHMAAIAGHADTIKILLAAGADPNVLDALGRTPLDLTRAQAAQTIEVLQAAGGKGMPSNGFLLVTHAQRAAFPTNDLLYELYEHLNSQLEEPLLSAYFDSPRADETMKLEERMPLYLWWMEAIAGGSYISGYVEQAEGRAVWNCWHALEKIKAVKAQKVLEAAISIAVEQAPFTYFTQYCPFFKNNEDWFYEFEIPEAYQDEGFGDFEKLNPETESAMADMKTHFEAFVEQNPAVYFDS